MKYFRLTAFLSALSLSFCINAQSIGQTYNSHINRAELDITDEKYAGAILNYDKAFETKTEFAADIYNACVCAIKVKDTKKLLVYANKLADKV